MIIDALENVQDSWENLIADSLLTMIPIVLLVLAVWVLNIPIEVAALAAGMWLLLTTFLNLNNLI